MTKYNLNRSIHIPQDIIEKESKNVFLKNLIITWVGYYSKAYDHYVKRDSIDEYVMHFCSEGKGFVQTNFGKWKINAGDIFICSKGQSHSYGSDKLNPWSVYWFHFIGNGALELLSQLGISDEHPVFHVRERVISISLINDIFKTLSTGYNRNNLLYSSTLFQELLCYFAILHNTSSNLAEKGLNTNDVISFMINNINKNMTLKEFSNHSMLSEFHFSRKFKEKIGYSPIEYFNRLKVQKSCELLDFSSMNIKEISNQLNFNNPYYFSEVFKKIIGYSPSKYRQKQKLK